jgi:NADH-quinone oxidoreductase subunit M
MRALLLSMGVDRWVLPALFAWPIVAAVLVRLLGRDVSRDDTGAEAPSGGPDARTLTLGALVIEALLALALCAVFLNGKRGWQARFDAPWIQDLGATISLGVDGLSMPLVVMTALVLPITLLGSWNNVRVRTPAFGALALLLTSGLIGVFISIDVLLFYLSWELMLIPTYLLVGVWSTAGKSQAALRYVLFTVVGSLLMLVALIALWNKGQASSFHYDHLSLVLLAPRTQLFMFLAFFTAFAVKSALVPFHSWFPDAQGAAPTFAAVTIGLKVGAYGILRFALPFFPAATAYPPLRQTILVLSVIAILYGALVAMAQRDFKRLISYSSISHLGFIMLGAFSFVPQGVEGAAMSIINSGITTSALFLLAGALEDRTGTTDLEAFGGLAKRAPWFALALTMSMLATIGLPGTSGFVGEWMVLFGSFVANPYFTLVAIVGVVFAAAYGLRGVQYLLYARTRDASALMVDLGARERLALLLLMLAIVGLGIAPAPVLRPLQHGTSTLLEAVQFGPNAPITMPTMSQTP